jgi:high-affinity nickel permease
MEKKNQRIALSLGTFAIILILSLLFSGYAGLLLRRLMNGLAMIRPTEGLDLTSIGTFGLLALGLVYGLKHATEVDHIVAVSTIVSEHHKLSHAALVGALWGVGHTTSLIIVGAIVLVLRTAISEQLAGLLEFGVAFMIIGLGTTALFKALVARSAIHIHTHAHDGVSHVHLHFHEQGSAHEGTVVPHSHVVSRIGLKPTLVGMMHGLAGSAALTLLVLTQIRSFA